MQVNKAVLQIFDFTSSLAVYSENELQVGEEHIQNYLQAHVDKAFRDPGARTGYIREESHIGQQLASYAAGETSLVALSKAMGEQLFNYMKQATEPVVMDGIFCEAAGDAGNYLCLLLCQAHDAYTHQLFSEDDGTLTTELVEHRTVLPMPTQKIRSFFAVNLENHSVRVFEPKGEYDGEVVYILSDKLLDIGTNQSSRDTVRKVKNIVNRVATAHESDGVAEMAKAKEIIAKNAEVSDTLDPVAVIEDVFSSNPIQQEAAKKELAEADMMRPLPVNREFAGKQGRQHKIKTDTGIEISFPVEYMKNRDFIEIVTNPDGTLRIELKNINKISNK